MKSRQLHRLAAALLAPVVLATAGPAGAQPSSPSVWGLDVGAVVGFPVAPAAFQDNWNTAWGLEGSLQRRLDSRVEWGLRGQFVQFALADLAGEDVLGGARRFGRITSPVTVRVWSNRSNATVVIDADAGYVHQSIEQVSHALDPPKTGPSDGFSAACGVAWRRQLYDATEIVLGLRHTWAFLPDETARYTTLMVGARAPLGVRR